MKIKIANGIVATSQTLIKTHSLKKIKNKQLVIFLLLKYLHCFHSGLYKNVMLVQSNSSTYSSLTENGLILVGSKIIQITPFSVREE